MHTLVFLPLIFTLNSDTVLSMCQTSILLSSGTSNWSGDYFVNTAGSALVVNQTDSPSLEPSVQSQLKAVFDRDWFSDYSTPLTQHSDLKDLC